jgi:hypothetical protein
MELAKPVFHVSLMDKIIQVLRCVCFKCSRLRVPREHSKMKELQTLFADRPRILLQQCAKLCTNIKQCGQRQPDNVLTDLLTPEGLPVQVAKYGCGEPISRVRRNPESGHYLELLEVSPDSIGQKTLLPPARVLEIFRGISDDDCVALGLDPKFSRPEWMVCCDVLCCVVLLCVVLCWVLFLYCFYIVLEGVRVGICFFVFLRFGEKILCLTPLIPLPLRYSGPDTPACATAGCAAECGDERDADLPRRSDIPAGRNPQDQRCHPPS